MIKEKNDSNRDWRYLLSFTLITIINYYLFAPSNRLIHIYAVGLPAALGLLLFLIPRIKSSEINFVVLLGIGHLIQFILFSIILAPFYYYKELYIQVDLFEFIPKVILATLLGQLLLFIGYYSNKSKVKLKSVFQNEIKPKIVSIEGHLILPLAIYIPIWIVRYVLISTGTYYHNVRSDFQFESSFFSPIAQISTLNIFVLAYLFILYYEAKKHSQKNVSKIKMILFLLMILEFAWSLPSGSREATLMLFILPFIVYYKHQVKIPKKSIVLLTSVILFFITFTKIYQAETVSSVINPNTITVSKTTTLVQQSFDQFEAGRNVLGYRFYLPFISRFWDGVSLSIVLSRFNDRYEYELGDTYFGLFYLFLPRFIFPDKPISQLALNDWFPEVIFHGSMPTTFIGESYINFGWVGIFLISLIVGYLIRYFDIFFIKRSQNIVWSALYFSLVYSIVRMTVQPVRIWVSTLVYSIFFGFVLVFFFNKSTYRKNRREITSAIIK